LDPLDINQNANTAGVVAAVISAILQILEVKLLSEIFLEFIGNLFESRDKNG
jgi:hypothetical protein